MDYNVVTEEQYKGYNIVVEYDDDSSDEMNNPRNWGGNLGMLIGWHRRYTIGDGDGGYSSPSDFADWLEEYRKEHKGQKNSVVVLPVYMYDHSGTSYSTEPFGGHHAAWDSGQVGFIFATREDILYHYSCKYVTKRIVREVQEALRDEVRLYDNYTNGRVFRYTITQGDEEEDALEIDSCGGYYDLSNTTRGSSALAEAKEVIDTLGE